MHINLKTFIWKSRVKLLVICLAAIVPLTFTGGANQPLQMSIAFAAEPGIPAGWESYLERPDILKMQGAARLAHDPAWESIKAAHFSFVAELLALYSPDTHIYFLARDSEHLYDVARLATEGTADSKRIHLLNVSRANMRDPNLKAYLKDNGISEEALLAGKKALFVDTGFAGTIPRVIAEGFSQSAAAQLKTHLVVSSNPDHPSSRSFLVHINPSANSTSPSNMHSSIISYEHMARYTDRSSKYIYWQGRYHPISLIDGVNDGSVSKEQSLSYMKDIKFEWQKPETQARFRTEKAQMTMIKQKLMESSQSAITELKSEYNKHSGNLQSQRVFEAQIRDLFEAKVNANIATNVNISELGFNSKSTPMPNSGTPKKLLLAQKFPEWAPILENPDTTIPQLFADKNWQLVGNLIDANVDSEINYLLIKQLFSGPAAGAKKDLQLQMIEKANDSTLASIAEIIGKASPAEMKDLISLIVEKAQHEAFGALAKYTFAKADTVAMQDLLIVALKKANPVTYDSFIKYTFAKPHVAEIEKALLTLINMSQGEHLVEISQTIFSQPYAKDLQGAMKALIQKTESLTDKMVQQKVVSALIYRVFSQPHSAKMTDILRSLVEVSTPLQIQDLKTYVFHKPFTQTSEHQMLKQALSITDLKERKAFLVAKLDNANSQAAQKVPVTTRKIDANLKPDDYVMVQNRVMRVIKLAGEGRRGIVFQVQAEDNKAFYALKTAKFYDAETLASLEQESSKAQQWQLLNIPHSKVLIQEKTYVLKTWVNGIGGDKLIESYSKGDNNYKIAAAQLLKLVADIRAKGAYIGDFRPANLIWTGKDWVIIDSGSIQQGMTLEEAQTKWTSADHRGPKFERRWKMPLPQPLPTKSCKALFGYL